MTTEIFVINLEKDVARRESITRQLETLGLRYQIVAGVYGAAMSAEERAQHYDDRKAKWRMARSLVPAEIGCALSHLNVYRKIVERDMGCALILEDDVVLPADLGSLLGDCERVLDPRRPEVWLLSPAEGDATASDARGVRQGQLVLPYMDGFYASSYIVTCPAARSLLAELYPVGDVADCWKRMSRYRVVDLFVVAPPAICQDQVAFGSSTTADYHQANRRDRVGWLVYKARRARSILWDLLYAPYRRWLRPYAGVNVPH